MTDHTFPEPTAVMIERAATNLYDYPKYYDVVFGSDWKAEYDFLCGCFDRHARREVWRLFEPACGTGRLLARFAEAGFTVAGNDLNPRAIAYCNRRLARLAVPASATVGDMADFTLERPVDAAFNMINSFRHLPSGRAATDHLRCVAGALAPGGLYMLGLHLTPADGRCGASESWTARRGRLCVTSRLWTQRLDPRDRMERVGMSFDVQTPKRRLRLSGQLSFRTYTAWQFERLLAHEPRLETVATYDFGYDLDNPVEVDDHTEDVVYVLRRR